MSVHTMPEKPREAPGRSAAEGPGRTEAEGPGRTEAVRELYLAHRSEVLGFLVTLVGDRELAEDLLHESFLRVFESWDRYDSARPFRPWLFQIVRNVAVSSQRRKKPRPLGEAAERTATSDRLLRELAAGEDQDLARAALDALSGESRALLILRHGVGLGLEEIAATLGVVEKTVRNRLQAAGEDFTRAWLAQRGGRS